MITRTKHTVGTVVAIAMAITGISTAAGTTAEAGNGVPRPVWNQRVDPKTHPGALARKIMDGSAGDVPQWAYRLLARYPDEAIPALAPGLEDGALARRERAVVALGYMGPAAAPVRARVAEALRRAPGEQEQRLIKWCLREIGTETAVAKQSR